MSWKRLLSGLVGVTVAALALAACGTSSSGGTAGSGSGGGKAVRIAYLLQGETDYNEASLQGAQRTAKLLGGTVTAFNANEDPSAQQSQCEDAIVSKKYTGMLIYPVDGGASAVCARDAIRAGIKVMALEGSIGANFNQLTPQVSGLTGSIFQPSSFEAGAQVAQAAKVCGSANPCEIGYVAGVPASSYDASKLVALKADLQKDPGLQLVAQGSSQFLASGGLTAAQDMLHAHPGIKVIICDDDDTASGIYKAVKADGKTGQVAIIAAGGSAEGVAAIRAGQLDATVTEVPQTAAAEATRILAGAIQGKSAKGSTSLAEYSLIPAVDRVLTAANVGEKGFKPQWGAGTTCAVSCG